ncbi:MAG: HPr family phosphocarrier protein [Longimicrobiales bacterium]
MRKSMVAAGVVMVGLTMMLACEQGTSVEQQAQPAEADQAALVELLREHFSSVLRNPAPPLDELVTLNAGSPVSTVRLPAISEWACDDGGKVTFSGDYVSNTDASGTGNFTYEGALTPVRCRLKTKLGTLEFNGDPSLTLRATRRLVSNNPDGVYHATVSGRIAWTTFGRAIRCPLDVEIRSLDGVLRAIRGKVCGLPI